MLKYVTASTDMKAFFIRRERYGKALETILSQWVGRYVNKVQVGDEVVAYSVCYTYNHDTCFVFELRLEASRYE